jgi:1-phosphofructokinase family hexose kinase
MATIITVTPNPLLNYISAEPIRTDGINRVHNLPPQIEGKGINVARVLQAHGHRVLVAGFAGGHSGRCFRELVQAAGFEDTLTDTAAPLRVGFMAPGAAGREHPTTLLADGFPATADECRQLLDGLRPCLADADLVLGCGSVPDATVNHLYADLLELCADAGVPCWIDSYGPAMTAALAGEFPPALAKPNRKEYQGATGELWDRAGEVHVSDGAKAIEVRRGDRRWRVIPPKVAQVNPVGSGDCYFAALAHARLSGQSLEEALAYAAAAGAANAAQYEVARIAPAEIARLAARVKIQ